MRKGEESESRTSELELDPADIWSIEEMVAEEKDEDKWVRRQNIAAGETSWAIASSHFLNYFHFFHYFHFFGYFHFFNCFQFFDFYN